MQHDYSALMQIAARPEITFVRGEGLLLALETAPLDAPALVRAAFDDGLLLNAPRPHTLRFMPALNVSETEVDRMLSLLGGLLERHAWAGVGSAAAQLDPTYKNSW